MIHIFIGTKAQLIKMAPIMKELQDRNIEYNFIHSGQHKETMSKLMNNFGLKKPDIYLYHGKDIAKVHQMFFWGFKIIFKTLKDKKKILKADKNGIILNHGDTFSALIGSILGKVAGLKTGHIESGLRSFNLFHPFPEEIMRLIIFKFTDYYFCPNQWSINNVKKYKGVKINTKLNTLYDSVQLAIKNSPKSKVKIPKEKYCISTLHRYENVFNEKNINCVIDIVEGIAKNIKVLFILHPATVKNLEKFGLIDKLKNNKNIELRQRYDYFEFLVLVNKSQFLISDGGSNQEESFFMGKPCLLLRKATERKEGLNKNVILSKYDQKIINEFVSNYEKYKFNPLKYSESPSKNIVNLLIKEEF